MKQKNPDLKILAAVGGANEDQTKAFSILSNAEQTRTNFVINIMSLVEKFSLSGIDVDYEFPETSNDKFNFVLLLQNLRKAFKASNLILSVAVAADKWRANVGYDIPKIVEVVDFINLMSYDYHGGWDTSVMHHAQMYAHQRDSFYMKELNCAASITYWISKGAPAEKLVLGIPTYGNTFVLLSSKLHKIGSDVNVNETKSSRGPMGYNEYCSIKASGWKQNYDTNYRTYYAVKGFLWYGFDSIQQVGTKAKYIVKHKLGGAVFWSIDTDDFSSFCKQGKFPLVRAALSEFENV